MRKRTGAVVSIMSPEDFALEEQYKAAKAKHIATRKEYEAIAAAYKARLDKLYNLFDPEYEKAFNWIYEDLTDEILSNNRPGRVWGIMRQETGSRLNKYRFGRLMKEEGFTHTTKNVVGPRGGVTKQARWRRPA